MVSPLATATSAAASCAPKRSRAERLRTSSTSATPAMAMAARMTPMNCALRDAGEIGHLVQHQHAGHEGQHGADPAAARRRPDMGAAAIGWSRIGQAIIARTAGGREQGEAEREGQVLEEGGGAHCAPGVAEGGAPGASRRYGLRR